MTKDNFTLAVVFFTSYWNNSVPEVKISIDGQTISTEKLEKNLDLTKFEYPIELDYGDHEISIQYANKNASDVFWNDGKRLRENFIKIERIYIDFVDLGNISKTNGKTTVLFDRNEFKIKFRSPIYYWMLHKVKDI